MNILKYLIRFPFSCPPAPLPPALSYLPKRKKTKVSLGNVISICPGGRHAWYNSNVGKIRKPIQP